MISSYKCSLTGLFDRPVVPALRSPPPTFRPSKRCLYSVNFASRTDNDLAGQNPASHTPATKSLEACEAQRTEVLQPRSRSVDQQNEEKDWAWTDATLDNAAWHVPWGPGTVACGMALWLTSFMGVAFVGIPALCKLTGMDMSAPGPSDKALLILACTALQTIVGLSAIWAVTAKPIRESSQQLKAESGTLFNFSSSDPFTPPHGWAAWAVGGTVASVVAVGAVSCLASASGYSSAVGGGASIENVLAMLDGGADPAACLSLLVATGVLAPVLEETVFRGFLFPSLSQWMPTWGAAAVSSAAFGMLHMSARDLPMLFVLGMVLSTSYTRSRNLLTPIVIHGVWNMSVLTIMFVLAARGVDLEGVLKQFS